ncbi:hypothetical protein [Arthrobacter sp. GMC3]|uniref:hypothetical protein n=1 Tax=Arthrobacter sp. GMC3 TaxID=2058894 RepID=UPI0015E3A31C|nr:hypothetical protein [Arthrobacter sp. GMC3]
MNDINREPVEISTHMRPGEWNQGTLTELVGSYQHKLWEMGAPEDEIETSVQTPDDGSAEVNVSWRRSGIHTFAATGQSPVPEAANSRGQGEVISPGESTKDAHGLGAVLGDAERSAIDAPPTRRAATADEDNRPNPDFVLYSDEGGKSYLEDLGPAKD